MPARDKADQHREHCPAAFHRGRLQYLGDMAPAFGVQGPGAFLLADPGPTGLLNFKIGLFLSRHDIKVTATPVSPA